MTVSAPRFRSVPFTFAPRASSEPVRLSPRPGPGRGDLLARASGHNDSGGRHLHGLRRSGGRPSGATAGARFIILVVVAGAPRASARPQL